MEIEWWEAELLDLKEQKKSDLPKITGGSLSWSIFSTVKGTGSVAFVDTVGFTPNWLSDRIRISFCKGDPDGDFVRVPFGIWLVSIPEWDMEALADGQVLARSEFTLSDKTEIFNSPIGQWLTINKGVAIVAKVIEIIGMFNETSYMIAANTSTMRSSKTWGPDDTWLTVINDLLDLISYSSFWADREGVLRSEPYVAPDLRPVVGTFGGDEGDMRLKRKWKDELPIFKVPTGFVVYVSGDDSEPGFYGRADLPPEHPLSAASRGREILLTDTLDAADQEAVDLKAQMRLNDSLQITRRTTIDHPIDIENFPEMNDIVELRMSGFKGAIVQREVKLTVGANVSATVRRIYTGGELPWG